MDSERALPKNIINYSIQDCEYYLKHYPNGLKAEDVRNRLHVLKSSVSELVGEVKEVKREQITPPPATPTLDAKETSSPVVPTKDKEKFVNEQPNDSKKIWSVLFKIFLTVLVVGGFAVIISLFEISTTMRGVLIGAGAIPLVRAIWKN